MRALLLLISVHHALGFLAGTRTHIDPSAPCAWPSLGGTEYRQQPRRRPRRNIDTPTVALASAKQQTLEDGGEDEKSLLARCYDKYLDLSERRPYPTKAVSAGVIVGMGAILSQWIQALSKNIPFVMDWHLVRSFALTGILFEGPYLHWWYEQLFKFGRFLDAKTTVSSRVQTMAQIAIDETIGVIIFFPAYFLAYELTQSLLLVRGTFANE